jgi:hypothetical protein
VHINLPPKKTPSSDLWDMEISPIIREDQEKKNGKCPLYLRYHHKGRFFIHTGQCINQEDWNFKKKKFKDATINDPARLAYKAIESELNDIVSDLRRDRIEPIAQLVKSIYTQKKENQRIPGNQKSSSWYSVHFHSPTY